MRDSKDPDIKAIASKLTKEVSLSLAGTVKSGFGVESKKERVVKNMSTAPALPTTDALADKGRRPIKIAIATSTTPKAFENARTVRKAYIQLINGLRATRGLNSFCFVLGKLH